MRAAAENQNAEAQTQQLAPPDRYGPNASLLLLPPPGASASPCRCWPRAPRPRVLVRQGAAVGRRHARGRRPSPRPLPAPTTARSGGGTPARLGQEALSSPPACTYDGEERRRDACALGAGGPLLAPCLHLRRLGAAAGRRRAWGRRPSPRPPQGAAAGCR